MRAAKLICAGQQALTCCMNLDACMQYNRRIKHMQPSQHHACRLRSHPSSSNKAQRHQCCLPRPTAQPWTHAHLGRHRVHLAHSAGYSISLLQPVSCKQPWRAAHRGLVMQVAQPATKATPASWPNTVRRKAVQPAPGPAPGRVALSAMAEACC